MRSFLRNKIASNAMWLIGGQIFKSIIGLIIGMLTARYLGPSNYGLISYAASIVTFLAPIMQLGLSNILVQQLTNYPDNEGEIIGTSILLSLFSSIACMIGACAYTFLVDVGEPTTNLVVILYSLLLVFQAIELIQYWFQAKLISKYQTIASTIAYVIVSVYKIILLISQASIYFFALSNSLDYALISIFLVIIYKKMGGLHLSFSGPTAKRMLNSSKHYIVSSLMVTIFAQTDKIMLKIMMDETVVGYYSAAVTCASLTSFVFSAVIDSFRPTIFQHKKIGDKSGYEINIERLYCITIYGALLQSVCMTIFAKLIISLIYGNDYLPAVPALQIIVWYTTFSYMGSVRNIWILAENKQKYLWVLNLGGAIANIILNTILIPKMGINGAAFASLITQFFTNVVMNRIVWPLKYNNHLMLKGLNPRLIVDLVKK